ncbi:MAG: hypothetical protein L6425_06310 [Candidatus Aminicenantes bacterium]|nr:hypothetical protein [Candidatus Aminicenantes bacterium]
MGGRNTLFKVVLILYIGIITTNPLFGAQSLDESLTAMAFALESGRFADYLVLLTPSLREKEEGVVESYLDDLGFETISVFQTHGRKVFENKTSVYCQVLYENEYSTLIEVWHLTLIKTDGGWKIDDKQVTGTVRNLYKIRPHSTCRYRIEFQGRSRLL